MGVLFLAVAWASALHPMLLGVATPPKPPSPVAIAVERLVQSECQDAFEECVLAAPTMTPTATYDKLQHWMTSRELLLRWAAEKWMARNVPPPLAITISQPSGLTLRCALAPLIKYRKLAKEAFRQMPLRALRLCLGLCTLWVGNLLLPQEVAVRHRRRRLAPLMNDIAELHEEVATLALW